MTKWITEPPAAGAGVEQEVFITLDDGSVILDFVMTYFDEHGKPKSMTTSYFRNVVAYKKIWKNKFSPTREELYRIHGEITDGKMPKSGKRIALIVETRPNQYHVEPGTFDEKSYEYSKKGVVGWLEYPRPYRVR